MEAERSVVKKTVSGKTDHGQCAHSHKDFVNLPS